MIETFVRELLRNKAPENLEPAVYDRLVKDLSDRAEQMANQRLLESLSDTQFAEFERLVDGGADPEAVQAFIAANVPDKEAVAAAALYEFRRLYEG